MAKFVVDRRTWHRGKGSPESRLLKSNGNRCCIGFVGQQCGISDEYLLNVGAVALLKDEDIAQLPSWMRPAFLKDNGLLQEAYTTNDDESLTGDLREAMLKEVFARYGDEIVFEN